MKFINVPKVETMQSAAGNDVPNQLILHGVILETDQGEKMEGSLFQSYGTQIAFKQAVTGNVYLDENYWDYSVTTGRYRNNFLNEGIAETRKLIKDGTHTLCKLN